MSLPRAHMAAHRLQCIQGFLMSLGLGAAEPVMEPSRQLVRRPSPSAVRTGRDKEKGEGVLEGGPGGLANGGGSRYGAGWPQNRHIDIRIFCTPYMLEPQYAAMVHHPEQGPPARRWRPFDASTDQHGKRCCWTLKAMTAKMGHSRRWGISKITQTKPVHKGEI
ncbi:hypothetical protein B0I35DRAFT_20685 [Stachybotrys elegans]|uniref:Uncharacterized protein n=1 Tax=Stachybotrys elegans TaxID=80388 RepID=A0A8K0T7G1_9HYPO|nr:hypothetical protein B0I35DRAFT_20685 [Stachybotrys elegans]